MVIFAYNFAVTGHSFLKEFVEQSVVHTYTVMCTVSYLLAA